MNIQPLAPFWALIKVKAFMACFLKNHTKTRRNGGAVDD
jgi:hypothetical protein